MKIPASIGSLTDVMDKYDGFILDLWGVVHNGSTPFPGTIPILNQLKKQNKKVWMLSNAPRRVSVIMKSLEKMGVTRDLYTNVMTSGEASRRAMEEVYIQKWGRRCFHLGAPINTSLYEGLDVDIVTDMTEADFVLCSSLFDYADPIDQYPQVLEKCAAHKLPMICANPDKVVHVGERLSICAGTLAGLYEKMDGEVIYFGKPYRGVYDHCLKEMQADHVLAVGDGMPTDIAGASGAGIDSTLVLSGIHRDELSAADLQAFLKGYNFQPTYVMQSFG